MKEPDIFLPTIKNLEMPGKRPSLREISERMKKQDKLNELERLIKLDLNTLSKQLGKHEESVVLETATRLKNELDLFINAHS